MVPTNTEAAANYRQKLKDAGLSRVSIWTSQDQAARLTKAAKWLKTSRDSLAYFLMNSKYSLSEIEERIVLFEEGKKKIKESGTFVQMEALVAEEEKMRSLIGFPLLDSVRSIDLRQSKREKAIPLTDLM